MAFADLLKKIGIRDKETGISIPREVLPPIEPISGSALFAPPPGISPEAEAAGLRTVGAGIAPTIAPVTPAAPKPAPVVSAPLKAATEQPKAPEPVTFAPPTSTPTPAPTPAPTPTPPPEQGVQVGNRMLTPEQFKSEYGTDVEKARYDDAQQKIRDYAQSKGLGYDQAARELGLEKYAGSYLAPDLGPLTREQLEKRTQEENENKWKSQQKEIQRQFDEQNKLLDTEAAKAQALASFQMARGGTLFTSSIGGYQDLGKADPRGPGTLLREMMDDHERVKADLNRQREKSLNLARDAFYAGKFQIAREFMADARQAAKDAQDADDQAFNNVIKAQTFAVQYAKGMRANAMEEIQTLIAGGQEAQITDGYLRGIEARAGASPGFGKALVEITRGEIERQKITDETAGKKAALDNAAKIADIQEKFPIGQTFKIGDQTYAGAKISGVIYEGVETDPSGRATYYSINKATGQVQTQDLGNIGTSKDGFKLQFDGNGNPWSYNERTGEMYYAGGRQADYAQTIPDGTKAGECGTFVRELTGVADPATGLIPNDLQGKERLIDRSIGTPNNPPRVGDVFVQAIGGWTGHMGIINTIDYAKGIAVVTESNYNKDGKVTNSRQVKLTDPTLRGFIRPDPNKVDSKLKIGTDAPMLAPFAPKEKAVSISNKLTFQKLVKDDPWIKDFPLISRNVTAMDSAFSRATDSRMDQKTRAAADQTLITLFNKILDPTSVVREGEYARSEIGQGFISRAEGFLEQITRGGAKMNDAARREMVEMAKEIYKNTYGSYKTQIDFYKTQADDLGIDPSLYISEVKPQFGAGRIKVRLKSTGQPGTILESELDKNLYEQL